MVTQVTSLGRSGVADWLIQRVSAVILAAYTLFLLMFFVLTPTLSYAGWVSLFAHGWMKLFTLMAVLAVVAHAWVGLWTVATDYIKSAMLRFICLALCILILFVYAVVAIQVLWGL